MKRNSILICLLFAISANLFMTVKAQVNTTDSLALVDFYNSTNGPHWTYHTNWLTTKPVSTWDGITVTNNSVTDINLIFNNISGPLPSSIGNLVNLHNLVLFDNHLTGAIPAEIGKLVNLYDLYLGQNQLSGAIPAEIGNLVNLQELHLEFNQLSGSIPAEIGKLVKLYSYLELQSNQLSGTIPTEIGNLVNLQRLYLSSNQLTGAIPAEIGNLISLGDLEVSFNQLSGAIPAELGKLVNLRYLYLANNKLSGTIPPDIGKLVKLIYLILNNNQLSGTVPAALKKLKELSLFNISYNQLSAFGYSNSFTPPNHKFYGFVNNNLFTFDGLQVIANNFHITVYAPQNTILPIHQSGGTLSVYAGGTLSNNTYKWFKVGSINSTTIKGDSTFTPTSSGKYYATVTNAIATKLTLYSDTISYTMPLAQTQNSIANVAAVKAFTNHFSVYPNPAKDIIHVQVNGNANIILTNSAGKILFSKTINNSGEINVSGYANGIYYLQNKTTGETQKVIVIH